MDVFPESRAGKIGKPATIGIFGQEPTMDRLFNSTSFIDFGPSLLHTSPDAPCVTHIQAPRRVNLRKAVRDDCPKQPGVYGMLDFRGDLIYVGKAKSLRGRLMSYFRPRSRDPKAGRILTQTAALLWEPWPDEFGALHRELELIRRWRPRCNVLGMPHSRQHTYICLGRSPAPYAFLARRPPTKALACFGPVMSGPQASDAVRRLNDELGLRDCPRKQTMVFAEEAVLFEHARVPACMRADLGTCLGPCAGLCTRGVYASRAQSAVAFLEGRIDSPLVRLEAQMRSASEQQQFEKAAALRDKWKPLAWLHQQLGRLREADSSGVALYPVTGAAGRDRCYLLVRGRAVAAFVYSGPHSLPPPQEMIALAQQRGRAAKPAEHVAGALLLAAWFRRRPEEKSKLAVLATTR
jgi:excinuclease ABC subunit C